jgi:radical SAM protein with 4Fe4S-binding SPASM domain
MRNSRGDQIRILIKPTVTRLNLPYFADLLVGAAERLAGCDVSIDISAYQKIGKDKTDLELSVTPEEFERELAAAATALMNRGFGAVPPANIAIAAESFALSCGGKLGDMDRPRILSCAPSFFVTNTGDVYPCQAFEVPEYRLGNVLENTSLRHMFDHGRFSELRRHMTRDDIEVCRDCEFRFVCTEHCHGCSFKSACKTNAFLGEDERACRSRTIKRLWLDTQNAREAAS